MSEKVFLNYTAEEVDQQYNNRAAVPEHPDIMATWQPRTQNLREKVRTELDLAYGSGDRETLDLYLPDNSDAPVLLFIHGGYWQALNKDWFGFIAEKLVESGVAVAVVNYSLCPDVSIYQIGEQMRQAVLWLHREGAQHGIDPNRIYVSGHSAGGHLVGVLFATDWSSFGAPEDVIKGGLSLSGLFELEPLIHTYVNKATQMNLELAKANSPALMQPKVKAPLELVVGEDESDEYHRQSACLALAWPGVVREPLKAEGKNHFTILDEFLDEASQTYGALKRLLSI